MEKQFQLEGKVVLITGSMSGIGLATAKLFLGENIKGIILLDIVENASILNELKNISNGAEILFRKCDVSDAQDMEDAYDYAWNSFGYIHLAVHSAGINDEDNCRRMVGVNVAGLIDGSIWLWKKMRIDAGGEGGTIINMSSIAGIVTSTIIPLYSATKHAVLSFSETLGNSFYFDKTGVRVLTVCPGLTRTPLTTKDTFGVDGNVNEEFEKLLKILTFQKPESVAKVVLEIYKNAASGTIWVSNHDQPAVEHLHSDRQELISAYFSK